MMCPVAAHAGERSIELSVQRVDGSLHGCARDRAGHTREFTGWLGLVGALEALLEEPAAINEATRSTL
jgi:hypothetical protein